MWRSIFLVLVTIFSMNSFSGVGDGKITDIVITADNVLAVRLDSHQAAGCVTWHHTFGLPYGSATSQAIYSMLLSAYHSGARVLVVGTGSCPSNRGYEVIEKVNIGEWNP